jgi:voltage-gated potassium channel
MTEPREPLEADPERGERRRTLRDLEQWLEKPMIALGLAWLVLLVVELTRGLTPILEIASSAIWVVFIADFVLRLALAPDRRRYVARNWLTAVSLLVPALRLFRAFRAVRLLRAGRALRGVKLVKVVGSLNRGVRAFGRSMQRRGIGYVLGITLVVLLGGAAGMYSFESERDVAGGFTGYGDALWWTTMIMATMGSDFWPRTAEGRILCVLLSLYAFAMFGYVTAALATFFIGREAAADEGDLPDAAMIAELRTEVARLADEVRALREPRDAGGA